MKIKAIAICILSLYFFVANACPPGTDSSIYNRAVANARNTYTSFMGLEALVYNGPLYKYSIYNLSEGSQYFTPEPSKGGTLIYNGIEYTNISLLFDVLNNKLIATSPASNQGFEIFTPQVSYFELGEHRFTTLKKTVTKKMSAGFYEIHYEGKNSSIYEIHKKQLNEELGEKYKKYVIEDESIFYIQKSGEYFKVEKKKSLYQAYASHQDELKSFIKNNHLSTSKITKKVLIKIAAYLDTL